MILGRRPPVALRKLPAPYRSAIALSNDAEFMTPRAFWDLHRFLNTTDATPLGEGLGLPITDSVFMYSVDPVRSFSYFEGATTRPSRHAGWLREVMQAGVVDVLHAYGDFDGVGGCTRELAGSALEELERCGVRLPVWTNHGTAENTQNIGGSRATYQRGDLPGSAEYHADLLTAHGVRLCWLDWNATNLVGQERVVPGRERLGAALRRLPAGDPLLREETLRDGSRVYVFQRYRGPNRPDPSTLAEQLSAENLDRLARAEGVMIVYQHLGCDRRSGACRNNEPPYLPAAAVASLTRLAERWRAGEVFVTGIARLLRYCIVRAGLRWHAGERAEGGLDVHVEGVVDPVLGSWTPSLDELAGVSFSTPRPEATRLYLSGAEVPVERTAGAVRVALPRIELPPRPDDDVLEG